MEQRDRARQRREWLAPPETAHLDRVAQTLLMLELTETLIAELTDVPAGTVLETLRSCGELDLTADDLGRAALMAEVRERLRDGRPAPSPAAGG